MFIQIHLNRLFQELTQYHRGTFSIVKEAVRKSSGQKFAIKFIDKKFVDKDDLVLLSREIDIMKQVDHPHVWIILHYVTI